MKQLSIPSRPTALTRIPIYAVFRYSVYALLTLNIYLFFVEEWAAATLEFPDGVRLDKVIEAYASTIDTAAWVILLLLFELRTRLLSERLLTAAVCFGLRLCRALCYTVIVYAFYGYLSDVAFTYSTSPLTDVRDLCALVSSDWVWTETLDQYIALTSANCSTLAGASGLFRFDGMNAAVDASTLANVRGLAWIDAINSGVWLLVVGLLEIDVRLEARRGYCEDLALKASRAGKILLYGTLGLGVLFWIWKGEFKDWWDALLWLAAFVFIEHNIFERRQGLSPVATDVARPRTTLP